tara:strand:- start:240 stop:638 length:399 start_codon:yes stop_codon:yes gene_type:complete
MEETQQINNCVDEMAKLKEKMETLEKQKILNEKNEMIKKTTMEPNLKVLENWLVKYRESIENNKKRGTYEKIKRGDSFCQITERRTYNGKRTGSYYNNPTEVMEAHIEATYNMFNIISKRLDDIEKKIGFNN